MLVYRPRVGRPGRSAYRYAQKRAVGHLATSKAMP